MVKIRQLWILVTFGLAGMDSKIPSLLGREAVEENHGQLYVFKSREGG